MTDKIFDDFIKNRIKDHSSPVPADMFERIIQTNDSQRRVGLFNPKTIISIFVMVFLCGGIGFIMWQPASKTSVNQAQSSLNTPEISTVNTKSQKEKTLPVTNADKEKAGNVVTGTNKKTATSGISTNFRTVVVTNVENQASDNFVKLNQSPKQKSISFNSKLDPVPDFNTTQTFLYSVIARNERKINTTGQHLLDYLKLMKLAVIVDCPTKLPRRDWYVEIFASPDFARKSIVKNSSINQGYYSRKDSTENMEGSFTAGIRLSKHLNDHILLKSGIQFSQINEQFKYRTENERRLTTVVTIRTIVRGPGDTVRIRDTSMLEQIGYRQQITHNKYRSIDIPVTLSYEWGGAEWKKSINAGILFNLRSFQEGEMLDTSFVPVAFNKPTGQTFKTNIGLGVYLGFSLYRSFGNKFDVFGEPYIRYNVSNMTTDRSLFTQKFNVAGINLGLRYKLSTARQHYYSR